ncbi:branched-chain amino acid ABC transporter substrate-binding protein [Mesorhizobium sp. M2A.F.Ca.ET.039.01.1.1]|uniref:branched-chain amino acid ABC transporter substrate-binding protein n=1 Tax=Mesorhizobium sp. M2A.F.Ca.ET.039.01.1.1 TaxID=2496746 RepID=UPI000FCA9062|nr:branched-chain amino acid ABC transporter substrate-binding protein [Mesorhizobium sp. M2A.F.Ca.ET.039.01.1.1]RWX72327.1 branched-chain amino acid ABC transporter substrate-binding protein [Mesorhizobium sp. M2A.F.Ca.ET.039.01.1.1]
MFRSIGIALGILITFTATSKADLLIGVAGPITGGNAAFGAQLQKGAEMAVADINAAGGVNGEQIKLKIDDDASDPKQGISVANGFVADGVRFVVGHFNAGISIPASEIYAENGILEVTPATTKPNYTERGMWNTFRTCGRDDQQSVVAAKYITKHFAGANIAIVHDKTPGGQGLADETRRVLNESGLKEVAYEGVNFGEKDFSSLIGKLKNANVKLVYWGGMHTEAGLLIRQMKDQGLSATLMSGDGIVSNELPSIAGEAVVGTLHTFGPDPTLDADNKDVVARFRAQGFNPEAYTLYSYAAVQVIAGAAAAAGSNDPQTVARAMHEKGPFKTVLGGIAFDDKGDPKLPGFVVYQWIKDADGHLTFKPAAE